MSDPADAAGKPAAPPPAVPLPPALKGKIIVWDRDQGCGYLEFEGRQVFLEEKNFMERHKRPEVGDWICFDLGHEDQGEAYAVRATHLNDGGTLDAIDWVTVGALLLIPGAAVRRGFAEGVGLSIGGYTVIASVLTYTLYWFDKRSARRGLGRTSEKILHFLEAAGGWPGAYLAQRHLRHKTRKVRYQVVFWLIVVVHQFLALDFCRGWAVLGRWMS